MSFQSEQHEALSHDSSRSAYMPSPRLAAAKVAPTSRQRARVKLCTVISDLPTTTPRLGFTVTETVRPPEPVVPDPFIATASPPPAAAAPPVR
jgi:hypothetical protein